MRPAAELESFDSANCRYRNCAVLSVTQVSTAPSQVTIRAEIIIYSSIAVKYTVTVSILFTQCRKAQRFELLQRGILVSQIPEYQTEKQMRALT